MNKKSFKKIKPLLMVSIFFIFISFIFHMADTGKVYAKINVSGIAKLNDFLILPENKDNSFTKSTTKSQYVNNFGIEIKPIDYRNNMKRKILKYFVEKYGNVTNEQILSIYNNLSASSKEKVKKMALRFFKNPRKIVNLLSSNKKEVVENSIVLLSELSKNNIFKDNYDFDDYLYKADETANNAIEEYINPKLQ